MEMFAIEPEYQLSNDEATDMGRESPLKHTDLIHLAKGSTCLVAKHLIGIALNIGLARRPKPNNNACAASLYPATAHSRYQLIKKPLHYIGPPTEVKSIH